MSYPRKSTLTPLRLADAPDALTIEETARVLRVSCETVAAEIRDGRIPHLRLRGRRVVPKTALETYLRTCGGMQAVESPGDLRALREGVPANSGRP